MKGITYKTAVIVMMFVGQHPSYSSNFFHAAELPYDIHEFVGSNKRNELPSFRGNNP